MPCGASVRSTGFFSSIDRNHRAGKKPLQHPNQIPVVLHARAFSDTVHSPQGVADIDTAQTQPRRNNGPNGTAAWQITAVAIVLPTDARFFAPAHKQCLGKGFAGVTDIGIGLDGGATVHDQLVIGIVTPVEIRLIGMGHIGAD